MPSGGGGFPGPQPGVGQQEEVVVDGYPIRVLPNTWKRDPAPRFGEKISTGDLRYQDFNPYESAASYSSFERGFGLRRFSDLPPTEDPEGFYAESQNVDCRAPGVCISPAVTTFALPSSTSIGSAIWMGEWTPSAGTVTGTKFVIVTSSGAVYYLTGATTAVSGNHTLGGGATATTVLALSGQIIVGFGAAAAAVYITTLDGSEGTSGLAVQDTSANALYVFAATSDRAAAYIAGGAAVTNTNTVLSAPLTAANPSHSFATAANAVTCKDPAHTITALAPGGGIAGVLVFVGMTSEFGMVDSTSTYRTIMPFEQALSTNCRGMTWWMNGDKSAVGTVLAIPVGRSLWSYSTAAGLTNMAAEGREGFRPINARGPVTAIQPSTHFLYYAVTPSNAASAGVFIIANDGVTGGNHTYRRNIISAMLPSAQTTYASACASMCITSLFGSNPVLYMDLGTAKANLSLFPVNYIGAITLPADGDWPPAESGPNGGNCTFDTGTTTLLLPDIDFGFPDEDKIPTFLRIVADSLVSGAQYITASYATEGSSAYTTLGTFFISPIQDIPFPSLVFKRMSIKLQFATNATTKTPIMNALSLRASINPKQYTLWSFAGTVPSGSTKVMADSPYNANTVINAFWTAYKAGTAVAFTDRWNKQWLVRILDFHEAESYQENLQTPGTTMQLTLLELYGTGLESAWDKLNTIFDNANMTWG